MGTWLINQQWQLVCVCEFPMIGYIVVETLASSYDVVLKSIAMLCNNVCTMRFIVHLLCAYYARVVVVILCVCGGIII